MSTQVYRPHIASTLAWCWHNDISPMSRLVSVVGLLSGRCQVWSAFDRPAGRPLIGRLLDWCRLWSAGLWSTVSHRPAVGMPVGMPVLIGVWSTVSGQLGVGPLSECRSARCLADVWFDWHVLCIWSACHHRPAEAQPAFRDLANLSTAAVSGRCDLRPAAIIGPRSGRCRQASWVVFSLLAQGPYGFFVSVLALVYY